MILITGGKGFIGGYVAKELEGDYRPLALGKDKLDITKPEDFDKLPTRIDAVVHTAGLLSIDQEKYRPMDYFMVNGVGTYNVCEYCRKHDVQTIIFMMTHSDVNRSNHIVIREYTPRKFGGAVPYITSKIAAMEILDSYSNDYGIRTVSFRLPGVRGYGSRDTLYNCVFHQFVQKAIKGEPIELWGEIRTQRDFVYVKDIGRAVKLALGNTKARGLYNIAMGKGHTIEDEARAIIKVFSDPNNKSKIIYRPDIPEVRKRSYIFDVSKACLDFRWIAKYSYEAALEDMKKEMGVGN